MKSKLVFLFLLLSLGGFFLLKNFLVRKEVKKGGEVKLKMEKGKILMIVAPENFRDEELLEPKRIFEENGYQVKIASKGTREAVGMLGARVKVDLDLSQVDLADFEAIVFVGGVGASVYFEDETALRLARKAKEEGKVLAAICIAPSVLANAGVLTGKRATSFPSEAENLNIKGAFYSQDSVTVDGKIVTARGPEAAREFGEKIVEVLEKGGEKEN